MGTVDYTGGSSVSSGKPARGLGMVYTIENELDFATTSCSAADVVQALDIPAGTHVLQVWCEVVTAEGAACTATVGDATYGAAAWDASTNLNAAAGTVTFGVGGTDANIALGGIFYAAAETIDLTMGHDTDTAVMNVIALCIDVLGQV